MEAVSGPVRLGTRWQRTRARHSLQRQIDEFAGRASRPDVTVWRVQPIVEVCPATSYPAWRNARERAWKRDGNRHSVRTWPLRIGGDELAAALLMQSHGGHRRGEPAEIAIPTFAHGVPSGGHDIEHPYEPLTLALLVGWIKLALADEHHAALLAHPLIDVIARCPSLASRAISASTGRARRASLTSVLAVTDKSELGRLAAAPRRVVSASEAVRCESPGRRDQEARWYGTSTGRGSTLRVAGCAGCL